MDRLVNISAVCIVKFGNRHKQLLKRFFCIWLSCKHMGTVCEIALKIQFFEKCRMNAFFLGGADSAVTILKLHPAAKSFGIRVNIELFKDIGCAWRGEEIALQRIRKQFFEDGKFIHCFNTFTADVNLRTARQFDRVAHQAVIVGAVLDTADEAAVDLDLHQDRGF